MRHRDASKVVLQHCRPPFISRCLTVVGLPAIVDVPGVVGIPADAFVPAIAGVPAVACNPCCC